MRSAEGARWPAGSSRARNRRGEGDRLRGELVEAAGSLLRERGDPALVSLRGVAAAVGVTAPSIYRHFPDKEALLFAVVEQEFADFDRRIRAAARKGRDDPFAALRLAGQAYVRFGFDHPAHYRVLFGDIGGATIGSDDREHPGKASFLTLVELVQRCQRAEPDPEGDAFAIAAEAWAFLHGLVDLGRACAEFPWPDRAALVEQWVARLGTSAGTT